MNHNHHHNMHDHGFQHKIASLESDQRKSLISPEELIRQLPIQENQSLLDIGAGTGFFTIPMAEITSGKVYALDPDIRMLQVIEEKAAAKCLTNIEQIHGTIETITLPVCSIHFAIASLILHEVPSLETALTKIYSVLQTGGHLFCLEYEKDELIVEGPPMAIRIGSEALKKMLSAIGFEIIELQRLSPSIYTIVAKKLP